MSSAHKVGGTEKETTSPTVRKLESRAISLNRFGSLGRKSQIPGLLSVQPRAPGDRCHSILEEQPHVLRPLGQEQKGAGPGGMQAGREAGAPLYWAPEPRTRVPGAS